MRNFKKKFFKFIKSKGGFIALLSIIGLLLLALFLIVVGVIYSDYGGDWGMIPAVLSCNTAITIYVVCGLIILILTYVYIWFKRKEDI